MFEIYGLYGGGNICTGDFVGIYYPREQNWFSVWQGYGRKSNCPGRPNSSTGFTSRNKHFECVGEVLRVYAKGKSVGKRIKDGDTLAFYYPFGKGSVEFNPSSTGVGNCLMPTSILRPSNEASFNKCKSETVTLKIF